MATYDQLVKEHEASRNGLRYIYNDRCVEPKGLLVILSTFRQGDRYAMLASAFNNQDYHFLHLSDADNSYYLQTDGGIAYARLIDDIASQYLPENVLLFGSSMAGYAAIRFAVGCGYNCLVNNPQLNLRISADLSWRELKESIEAIPKPVNLEDEIAGFAQSVIGVVHSRHPMDLANMEILYRLALNHPSVTLIVHHVNEMNHRYLLTSERQFFDLVGLVLRARAIVPVRESDVA